MTKGKMRVIFLIIAVIATSCSALELPCDYSGYGSSGTTLLEVKGLVCYFYNKNFAVPTHGTTVATYRDPTSGSSGRTAQRTDIKLFYPHTENSMRYIPLGIEKFFPNLEVFYLYNVKIRAIYQSDLKPFRLLSGIYAYGSELLALDGNIFRYNPQMARVQFESISPTYIGKKLLDNLGHFKTATFGGCLGGTTYAGIDKVAQFRLDAAAKCGGSSHRVEPYYEEWQEKLDNVERSFGLAASLWYLSEKKRIPEKTEETFDIFCHNVNNETCEVENMKVATKDATISGVKNYDGNATTTEAFSKVEILDQQVLFMPTDFSGFFQKMTKLFIMNSGLIKIDSRDLDATTLVTVMNFTGNKIHEIPKDTFKGAPSLEVLNLSHNALMEIEDGGLDGLGKLQVLSLEYNLLTTLRDKTFDSLVKLKELTLNNNKLKYIGLALLTPLGQMKMIDLKDNECINTDHPTQTLAEIQKTFLDKCIAPVALECWYKKVEVELSTSKKVSGYMCEAKDGFKTEHPKTSIFLSKSQHIDNNDDQSVTIFVVRSKSLTYIPITVARAFPKLKAFLIDDSGITAILKGDFQGFENLQQIVIRGNDITKIESGVFDDVPKIEYLDLSHNKITALPANIFVNLVVLKTLVISSNPLENLSYKILPQLSKIDVFEAKDCNLMIIETKIIKSVKNAKIIDLRGNQCTDLDFKRGNKFMEFFNEVNINCCHEDCI